MFELSESMIREVNCFYIYLFPEIVEKLSKSVFLKAKKGAKIIAVSFGIKAEYSDDFKLVLQRKIGWHNIYIYEKIR
jgi:arginyl-tRNA synthetase